MTTVDGELIAIVAFDRDPDDAGEVAYDAWILRGRDTLELSSPATTGLDQRIPGPENFRFGGLGPIISSDLGLHVATTGQWWLPFATADSDFAWAFSADSRTWTQGSIDELDNERHWDGTTAVAAEGSTVMAAGSLGRGSGPAELRITNDGVTWATVGMPLPDGDTVAQIRELALSSSDIGLAFGRTGDDTYDYVNAAFWRSADRGATWSLADLPPFGDRVVLRDLDWDGDRFVAVGGHIDAETDEIWQSTDGLEWSLVTSTLGSTDLPFRFRDARPFSGGVVGTTDDAVIWSPAIPVLN